MTDVPGTFQRTDTIQASQYTGSRESAEAIAATYGLQVVDHIAGLAAAFLIPAPLTPAQDLEREGRIFSVVPGGWVWRNPATNTVGAEWDQYFREHFAPAIGQVIENDDQLDALPDDTVVYDNSKDTARREPAGWYYTGDGTCHRRVQYPAYVLKWPKAQGDSVGRLGR